MDKLTPTERSRVMSKVHGKNTTPEMRVRRTLHALGYRFRLHRKDLPGKPDIVLPKYRSCIFVHGCFWHQHSGCKRASKPSTNTDFWSRKLDRNVERGEQNCIALQDLGWNVIVIWECETKDLIDFKRKIRHLLEL
jgi:DNA mismatch endonuclease (patch repair protein)